VFERGSDWSPARQAASANMHREAFVNQRDLIDYAEAHDLAYAWEGSHAFAKRWRLAQLAQPSWAPIHRPFN